MNLLVSSTTSWRPMDLQQSLQQEAHPSTMSGTLLKIVVANVNNGSMIHTCCLRLVHWPKLCNNCPSYHPEMTHRDRAIDQFHSPSSLSYLSLHPHIMKCFYWQQLRHKHNELYPTCASTYWKNFLRIRNNGNQYLSRTTVTPKV